MNISGALKTARLPVKTVCDYAYTGLVEAPSRSTAGYRTYTDVAVRKLAFMGRSREFEFNIEECCELLGLYKDRDRTSSEVKRIASSGWRNLRSSNGSYSPSMMSCRTW